MSAAALRTRKVTRSAGVLDAAFASLRQRWKFYVLALHHGGSAGPVSTAEARDLVRVGIDLLQSIVHSAHAV